MRLRGIASVTLALWLGIASTGPALAEDPTPSVDFNFNGGETLKAGVDQLGEAHVLLPLKGSSQAIFGSWTSTDGTWASPKDEVADINTFLRCVFTSVVNEFGANANADSEYVNNQLSQAFKGGVTDHAAFKIALLGCLNASKAVKYMFENSKAAQPSYDGTINLVLPYDKFQPGVNHLWILDLQQNDTLKNAFSADSLQSGQVNTLSMKQIARALALNMDFFVAKVKPIDAIVPALTAAQQDQVTKAEIKSGKAWSKRTSFSKLGPIDFGYFSDPKRLLSPAAQMAGISVVLSILIAIPTTLIQSAIDGHPERVERLLRGFNGIWRRLTKPFRRK